MYNPCLQYLDDSVSYTTLKLMPGENAIKQWMFILTEPVVYGA